MDYNCLTNLEVKRLSSPSPTKTVNVIFFMNTYTVAIQFNPLPTFNITVRHHVGKVVWSRHLSLLAGTGDNSIPGHLTT